MTGNLFDETTPLDVARVVAIYERLRHYAPPVSATRKAPARHERLHDILDGFDGLLLDGYGVLFSGGTATDGAAELLATAKARGVGCLALTNGGSRAAGMIASGYRNMGLDIGEDEIVSSRDALMAAVGGINRIGVAGGGVTLPDDKRFTALSPDRASEWREVEAIGFFGATGWDMAWQGCLRDAMQKGVPVLVANADVAAPLAGGRFSREPGYWVAAILDEFPDAPVTWYGKPHKAVFDLAAKKIKGDRIAMVGDSLHTDILGGNASGLATVLVTGYGLFRDGGLDEAMKSTGIIPDYIVERL